MQRHHEDSDQEDRQVPGFTQHRSASRESQTVSSLSSNSQGTASHSGRSSSQSGSQPKRRKHRHSNSQPHPPESPLEDSSHSSRDHRRLQKSRDRMVETRHGKQKAAGGGRGGTGRAIGKGGSPRSRTNKKTNKGKGKRKRGDDDDLTPMERKLKAELDAIKARIESGDLTIEPVGPRDDSDDDYSDDNEEEEEEETGAGKPEVASRPIPQVDYENVGFNMGDPNDEKNPMWLELYKIMREKVYREWKFINEEEHKDRLCEACMDHLGIPQLTLTGRSRQDAGTYQIWLAKLTDSCF